MAHEKTKTKEPLIEPDKFVIPFTRSEWSVISAALLETADGLTWQADKLEGRDHRLSALFLQGCAGGLSDMSGKIERALEEFNEQRDETIADRIVAGLMAKEGQQ